jgi:hypothetical protein
MESFVGAVTCGVLRDLFLVRSCLYHILTTSQGLSGIAAFGLSKVYSLVGLEFAACA